MSTSKKPKNLTKMGNLKSGIPELTDVPFFRSSASRSRSSSERAFKNLPAHILDTIVEKLPGYQEQKRVAKVIGDEITMRQVKDRKKIARLDCKIGNDIWSYEAAQFPNFKAFETTVSDVLRYCLFAGVYYLTAEQLPTLELVLSNGTGEKITFHVQRKVGITGFYEFVVVCKLSKRIGIKILLMSEEDSIFNYHLPFTGLIYKYMKMFAYGRTPRELSVIEDDLEFAGWLNLLKLPQNGILVSMEFEDKFHREKYLLHTLRKILSKSKRVAGMIPIVKSPTFNQLPRPKGKHPTVKETEKGYEYGFLRDEPDLDIINLQIEEKIERYQQMQQTGAIV